MSSKKKLIILMVPLILLLSGCAQISIESGGVWNFLVIIFAKIIVLFSNLFGNSLGWGIVMTTLVIRLIMVPLYGNQIKSSVKMQEIQPKINKLNEKYAGKKDSESQRKKAQEQQAIYGEAGINPLAGCLPLLLQLPLLIAFYEAIEYLVPPSSIVDSIIQSGGTPIYGLEELGAQHLVSQFYFWNLAEPAIFFAIIAAVTTFLTTYLSTLGQDQNGAGAGMMKGMLFFMPVMIFFMGLNFPAALSIYWTVGNIISILQTVYFKRSTFQTMRQKNKIQKS